MKILYSEDAIHTMKFEGFEPRIIKRFIENKVNSLNLIPNETVCETLMYNGREIAIFGEHMGRYIFLEHVIFNVIYAK